MKHKTNNQSMVQKLVMVSLVLLSSVGLSACENPKDAVISKVKQEAKNEAVETITDKINDAADKIDTVSDKIKEVSPSLKAEAFKSFKACLVKAADKNAAIECHKEAAKNMYELGIEEDDTVDMEDVEDQVGDWSPARKERQLKEMDAVIDLMEAMSQGFGQ